MGSKKKQKSAKKQKVETDKTGPSSGDLSFEQFLDNWDDKDDKQEDDDVNVKIAKLSKKSSKKEVNIHSIEKKDNPKLKKKRKKKLEVKEDESDSSEDEAEEEEEKPTGAKSQKKYLKSLKSKDPDFYDFLKEEDGELLNFDESSDEDEKSDDEEGDVHELPDKLEVGSDESDFEDEEKEEKEATSSKAGKVTPALIEEWRTALESSPGPSTISKVIEAFRAAVSVVGSGEGEETPLKYRVEGGTMFNSVVRLCVVHLNPAIRTFLKSGESDAGSGFKPEKCKKWKKVEKCIRAYLAQLCTLIARITEPSVCAVLLKHVHQMIPFFQAYPKGEKQLLVKMITCWCQGEETVRILALMCIVRIVRGGSPLLETAIKQMYMAYVKNCKFTSPSTLPHINFMRRSLVEVLALDHSLAYYQAFIHIRQLAIHLRNAIVNKKKDSLQAVYNWQYVHSMELWGALLGHAAGSEVLEPLIYPLVQVVLGTLRLVPTAKYFPLRFHCGAILTSLSSATGTFIPILPIYLDVLNTFNFGKKSKKVSMKPLEFSTILKASKSQQTESGFKDGLVEEIYSGMLVYLAANCNRIGFPELVTPLIFQLKDFLKRCKQGNYCKKIKQILDKVVANQKFIETRRKSASFGIGDTQKIQVWEAQVERDGTPLLAFYKNWKKIADTTKLKQITDQKGMDDYSHIPTMKRNKLKMRRENREGLGSDDEKGFLSGSDDDMDDQERFELKEDRGKRKRDASDSENESGQDDEPASGDEDSNDEDDNAAQDDDANDDEDDDGDDVQDLRLEDMDSDSELELQDDFAVNGDNDSSDEEDGSDEGDEESD